MGKINWILLRGLARENAHWHEFPVLLKKCCPDSVVLLLEIPGSGEKYKSNSFTSISENVKHLRAEFLSKTSKIEGAWGIISVSLGGMIALEWSSKYSDFEHVVTINSSLGNLSPFYKRLKLSTYMTFAKLVASNDVAFRERKVWPLSSNYSVDEEKLQVNIDAAKARPLSKKNFLYQLIAAATYKKPLSKLHGKLLVLASIQDSIVDYHCSVEIASMYGGEISLHPTGGHDLPIDEPDWVVERIVFVTSK